jgi:hypothetical protein
MRVVSMRFVKTTFKAITNIFEEFKGRYFPKVGECFLKLLWTQKVYVSEHNMFI